MRAEKDPTRENAEVYWSPGVDAICLRVRRTPQGRKQASTRVYAGASGGRSREPDRQYCSRVCCTHSIHNALELKKLNPEMNVFILYRDIRTYGEREYLYKKAREAGVMRA